MELKDLLRRCLTRTYVHAENAADFATERTGDTLFVYLQASSGAEDWRNNLDFPARPYRSGGTLWWAHRGFVRVWKTVESHIARDLLDSTLQRIVTVGYSHGAALALLCHEYVWYHRPDLRDVIEGYGFGCPRVLWGLARPSLLHRWDRFWVIRNLDDAVTHVPPAFLGYRHVGKLLEVGTRGKYNAIDAHRPENILRELESVEVPFEGVPLSSVLTTR